MGVTAEISASGFGGRVSMRDRDYVRALGCGTECRLHIVHENRIYKYYVLKDKWRAIQCYDVVHRGTISD